MSATVSSYPHQQTVPNEPFGQAGVRQYIGRILAWIFFTLALVAAAMAQRSGAFMAGNGYSDNLQWRAKGQALGALSMNGQLALFGGTTLRTNDNGGWAYRGGYVRDFANRGGRRWGSQANSIIPWETDFGQLIGIEYQSHPPTRDFTDGFLLRFKWVTLAALFMIQPLVYVFVRLRRRRVEARDEA